MCKQFQIYGVKPDFYAKEEGIFAGGSTDRNVVAALAIAKELGAGKPVVTFGCENGIKYLSGPIYS
ncbi:MAG: hypothetical protein RLZZ97_38 [Gemmatimonadota bacterium]|jgi:cysteine synthase A